VVDRNANYTLWFNKDLAFISCRVGNVSFIPDTTLMAEKGGSLRSRVYSLERELQCIPALTKIKPGFHARVQ
jgi:hypothetical protein